MTTKAEQIDDLVEKVARAIRQTPTRDGGFVDYEDIARAAISAVGCEGWQPIDSAPKDGSTILLVERTWGGEAVVTPGRYFEDERGWWEHGSHPTDYADQPIDNPTHWRPLPQPPVSKGEKM